MAVNLQEVAYSLYPLKDLPYVCIDKKDRQAVMFLLNIYGFSDPGRADGQLITYSKQRRRRAQSEHNRFCDPSNMTIISKMKRLASRFVVGRSEVRSLSLAPALFPEKKRPVPSKDPACMLKFCAVMGQSRDADILES